MNFRLAYRYLVRTPGFAIFSILELALGIGLTTIGFFVINAVLLRPLDLPHPDRLVQIQTLNKKTGRIGNNVPGLDFADLRDRTAAFDAMSAYWGGKSTALIGKRPEQVRIGVVSRGWHETIGIQPALGTGLFSIGTDENGALVSSNFWRSRLGGEASVLGRSIQVEGKEYTIHGVMPNRGVFPEKTDVWLPMIPEKDGSTRTAFNYRVIARMKAGATPEQARANLAAVAAGMEQQYPNENKNRGYTLTDLRERLVGSYRSILFTLGGAVLLVLVIACANVTNLLLARAVNRKRELAIRVALGARVRHLFGVVLSESLLVSLTGGALGLLLAAWLRESLLVLNPFPIPRLADAGMDQTVVGFAVLASVLAGAVTGLLPAWRVWRSDVQEALAGSSSRSSTGTGDGIRSGLLVAEVAFSVLLLVGAGLLLRSFARLTSVDPGFRADNLTMMESDLSAIGDQGAARMADFYQRMRDQALAMPGVVDAAWHRDVAATESGQDGAAILEGRPMPAASELNRYYAEWHLAGPGFFQTIHVPVRVGREFTAQDTRSAPDVAVVNEAFVKTFFAEGENPLGRRFRIGLSRMDPITIVGVVGDVRQLARPAGPQLYVPYVQHLRWAGTMFLTVRTQGPTGPLIDTLRRSAASTMPEAVVRFTTMKEAVGESIGPARFRTVVLGLFSTIALILSLTGLYAVCAYLVQSRTREIGLRMALGAQGSTIVGQFIGKAIKLTGIGVVLGMALAFAMRNVLSAFLFEIPSSDWLSYAGTAALLTVGAIMASFVPAWRASRTDPAVVLREE